MTKNSNTVKFVEPSDLEGDWSNCRGTNFWHAGSPIDVKRMIEKITGTLLKRDTSASPQLSDIGTSRVGGDSRFVWLRYEATIASRTAYSIVVKSSAPRRWVSHESFLKSADRAFSFWSSKLEVPVAPISWADADQAAGEKIKQQSAVSELILVGDDLAVIENLQQTVLAKLRCGMVIFTAHKEGNTCFAFDGKVFTRLDRGEKPDTATNYPDDAAMFDCLYNFFDWEMRRDVYPHSPSGLEGWTFILNQLVENDA